MTGGLFRRPWRSVLGLTLGLVGIAALTAVGAMTRADAAHDRFFAAGESLNGFLKEYCRGLGEALREGSLDAMLAFYAPGSRGREVRRWGEETWEGGASISALTAEPGSGRLSSRFAFLDDVTGVERTACKIDLIERLTGRGEAHERATLTVKLVLDGSDRRQRRLEDRIFFRWQVVRAPAARGGWRITADELVEGVRTAGPGTVFLAPDPEALGIGYRHRRDPALDARRLGPALRFGLVEHSPGGISASDYDGDGRPDLFFADGVASRLLRNLGPDPRDPGAGPRFADVTAEAGLPADLGAAFSALFADFDNDGDRDLFVARYRAPNRYFENRGDGTFRDRSAAAGLDVSVASTSATVLDYDLDGFLDLYLAVYGDAFEAIPRLPFFARNGGANRLFHNDGGRGFTDVTEASGTGDIGWSLAVAAADYDQDGLPDLAVANDFGRKNLYRNLGDGTFREVAKEAGVLDFSAGMGLVFGDYDGDGRLDLYTSNIKSNQRWFGEDETVRRYLRNVSRTRWALLDFGEYRHLLDLLDGDWSGIGRQTGEGNSLFHNQGDGTFSENRTGRTHQAGWSWGVAFLDYDNDADLDLYAANGWISNSPGTDL